MSGRLLDPKRGRNGKHPFAYVPSAMTDIRATFDRVAPGWNLPTPPEPEPTANVQPIKRSAKQ